MINSQDSLGNTPLHIAINQGHKDCTLFLLDKGADTNIKNKSHQAPIHVCIISNRIAERKIELSSAYNLKMAQF